MQEKLEQISGFKNNKVRDFIGLPLLDYSLLSINYFFTFPAKFQQFFPEIFEKYSRIFNQNPLDGTNPVIDPVKRGTGI